MMRPRVSLATLVVIIAVFGVHLAVANAGESFPGLDGMDIGLLPVVTAVAVVTLSAWRSGWRGRPFLLGFATTLVAAATAYIMACLAVPGVMLRPFAYYWNEIEPRLTESDRWEVYALNRVICGYVVGLPLVALALMGGIAGKFRGRRLSPISEPGQGHA